MATSGENVQETTVRAECNEPTTLLGFPVLCNFNDPVELSYDTNGQAWWACPYCHHLHEAHVTDWDT